MALLGLSRSFCPAYHSGALARVSCSLGSVPPGTECPSWNRNYSLTGERRQKDQTDKCPYSVGWVPLGSRTGVVSATLGHCPLIPGTCCLARWDAGPASVFSSPKRDSTCLLGLAAGETASRPLRHLTYVHLVVSLLPWRTVLSQIRPGNLPMVEGHCSGSSMTPCPHSGADVFSGSNPPPPSPLVLIPPFPRFCSISVAICSRAWG